MQIDVTFRRMEASNAIREYLDDKMSKMKKFLANPWHMNVVLTSERFRNKADVALTLKNGLLIKGVDTSDDMYFSIDQAVARIERQLRKYKEKIHSHKPSNFPARKFKAHLIDNSLEDEFNVVDYDYSPAMDEVSEVVEETAVEAVDREDDFAKKIIRTNEYSADPMNIEAALMQIELQNRQFLVFTNSKTNSINVLYRREEGKFGLIDTHHE
jgi:ribosome hibernation promoting factor